MNYADSVLSLTVMGNTANVTIQGLLPSFKNRKRICGNRLITDPAVKRRMREVIRSLCAAFSPTGGGATSTASSPPCATAWLPRDDNWTVLPEVSVTGQRCAPGAERVEIILTLKKPSQ